MNLRNVLSILSAFAFALILSTPASASAIWVGIGGAANEVVINYGTVGSTFFYTGGSGGISAMTLFGNQVWVDDISGGISRFDQSGNPIGAIETAVPFTTMAVVGNQMWAYNLGNIYCFSSDGTLQSKFSINNRRVGGIAEVGNSVWMGQAGGLPGSNGISVYDLNGKYLYGLLPNQNVQYSIAVNGNQVWVANSNVKGRSKPATSGRLKTSHFEEFSVRRYPLLSHGGIKERWRGESTQNGNGGSNLNTPGSGLVAAADRP